MSRSRAHTAGTNDIELTGGQIEFNRSGPRGPWNPERLAARAAAVSRTAWGTRSEWQQEGRGVCAVSLGDTHIVQHMFGAIQEYAGFDEPRWLDGPPRKNGAVATS